MAPPGTPAGSYDVMTLKDFAGMSSDGVLDGLKQAERFQAAQLSRRVQARGRMSYISESRTAVVSATAPWVPKRLTIGELKALSTSVEN